MRRNVNEVELNNPRVLEFLILMRLTVISGFEFSTSVIADEFSAFGFLEYFLELEILLHYF